MVLGDLSLGHFVEAGGQAGLGARSVVLVEDSLLNRPIQMADSLPHRRLSFSLVASINRAARAVEDGTGGAADTVVSAVALDRLAGDFFSGQGTSSDGYKYALWIRVLE